MWVACDVRTSKHTFVHASTVDDIRVLVVDDEPMVREVLARSLEREGFAVDTAVDGEQAMDRFNARTPDLVLLDLMLPHIDGLEVFRRMRADAAVPAIMLTAAATRPTASWGWTSEPMAGLGLALAKRIEEAMGGHISAQTMSRARGSPLTSRSSG